MSLFGTFRRVKKGKQPTQYYVQDKNTLKIEGQQTFHGLSESVSKSSLSNSTPNLHKLQQQQQQQPSPSPSSNQSSVVNISITDEDEDNQSTGGDSVTSAPCHFDSRLRSGSMVKTTSSSSCSSSGRPYVGRNTSHSFNFSTGTLTKFVSMVALGGTSINKKSTSKRKPSHHYFHQDNPIRTELNSRSLTYSKNEDDGEGGGGGGGGGNDSQNYLKRFNDSWICEDVDEMKDSLYVRNNDQLRLQHEEQVLLGRRRDLMLQGVKKFNRNCAKGMDFFVKNNFVDNSPEEIAKFLATHEDLSKTSIGDYLGTYGEFHETVLNFFVANHHFKGKGLVESLRIFLASFRLPGEAQKIDRMMETFASHYCVENPGIFEHQDSCYILSFSIIMLNTSLHNPNVKEKPTVEQFITMNRDIDQGKTFDPNFLTRLYNSIRDEEFQIPKEDVSDLKLTFSNADKKGWLWKQGARYKNWTRRWFILSNNCLYYFKSSDDTVPRSIIPLENLEASEGSSTGKYFIFILTKNHQSQSEAGGSIKSCKTKSDGTIVLGGHSEYVLGSESPDERRRWIFALKQYSSFSSYYTLVQQKKKNMTALLQRRPNKDKNNSSTRIRKATVRKSQISMPLERPSPVLDSSMTGSEDKESLTESLTESYEDDEFSISNFDEQSLASIRIQIDSPNHSQSHEEDEDVNDDDDDNNSSQFSIKSNKLSISSENINNNIIASNQEDRESFSPTLNDPPLPLDLDPPVEPELLF